MRLRRAPAALISTLLALLACTWSRPFSSAEEGAVPKGGEASSLRSVIVVSDLHLGLGKKTDGSWFETEDFRWPRALEKFLETISAEGKDRVDLVIAGDFLELWQPPECEPCSPPAELPNYGCTREQLRDLAGKIVSAHGRELAALGAFAARGDNCLWVVPGNHDAALVDEQVWAPVGTALSAAGGCVHRQGDGVWYSANGELRVEHGHEIGRDVNSFREWPHITREISPPGSEAPTTYFERPWGEAFVQTLYNAEERALPILDNLSPTSAGARYRLAEAGLAGKARDVAKFLAFNLFETSMRQKGQALGGKKQTAEQTAAAGRKSGPGLFIAALPEDDPLALRFASAGADGDSLRQELDEMVQSLSDDEILALCDLAGERGHPQACVDNKLGAAAYNLVFSRERIVGKHVRKARSEEPRLRAFVYGHTHSFELPWTVKVFGSLKATVANSGAFQRVIDDERFRKVAQAREVSPADLLKTLKLEELPACYTSVRVTWPDQLPEVEVRAWWMPEDGQGEFVDPCDDRCPSVGHGC